MKFLKFISLLFIINLITACGAHFTGIPDTPEENEKFFKLGKPYKIDGKWYYPQHNENYSEVGMASWYGPGFHNEYTANGEVFDKYEMTAAHRTLPLPSMVRVTNLENNRSVVLRVNDRGPFAGARIIDVSKKAAKKLGFLEKGTAKVRVTYLPKETAALFPASTHPMNVPGKTRIAKKAPLTKVVSRSLMPEAEASVPKRTYNETSKSSSLIYVQAASFTDKNKAQNSLKKLQNHGKTSIVTAEVNNKKFFRVKIGPFSSEKSANKVLKQISSEGFNNAFIITE